MSTVLVGCTSFILESWHRVPPPNEHCIGIAGNVSIYAIILVAFASCLLFLLVQLIARIYMLIPAFFVLAIFFVAQGGLLVFFRR